ncbi:MAG TPA: hypothetical protein VMV35_06130 [Halothiobacillus sp.]|nr:hypothetical protein [Halothiobacillus sp.]
MPLPTDWLAYLKENPLPVRGEVHEQICRILRREEGDQGALVGWIRRDPGACAFIMGTAARAQRAKNRNAPHSLDHALSLLGDTWAKSELPKLHILEEVLTDESARAGYFMGLSRSLHAARHAESWLTEFRDTNYEIVVLATLLHNFIELALWRDAPEVMRAALARVRDNRRASLGSATQDVLKTQGIDLADLERELGAYFYLPTQLYQDESASPVLAKQHQTIVVLSRRLCFYSELGWYHAEIMETKKHIAELLNRDLVTTDQLIHSTAIQTAHEFYPIGFYCSAKLLIDTPRKHREVWPLPSEYGVPPTDQQRAYLSLSDRITRSRHDPTLMIKSLLASLIEGLHCRSVVVYGYVQDAKVLTLSINKRAEGERVPERLSLQQNPLFDRLFSSNKAIQVQDENRHKLSRLVDEQGQKLIHADCYIQTLSWKGSPFALLIIDTRPDQGVREMTPLFEHFLQFWSE